MKSIFEEDTYNRLLNRINNLNENSERQWGKMTVGQMAWHCQFPLQWAIENKNKGNGNFFVRLLFKKSMYNDKSWRKNLPTFSNLKTQENKNINTEKEKLKQLTIEFHVCKTRTEWNPHELFGKLTHEQWGQMQYKHLNHHLTQFGV